MSELETLKASRAALVEQEQRTRAECNRLRAACAEMRAALVALVASDSPEELKRMREVLAVVVNRNPAAKPALMGIDALLSTDCGNGWVPPEQVKVLVEALTQLRAAVIPHSVFWDIATQALSTVKETQP